MLNPGSLISGGGIAGLILALGYFIQQFVKARVDVRAAGPALESSSVRDAAAANAVLVTSLKEERARIAELVLQVKTLTGERDTYREQVWQERSRYEQTIRELMNQLNGRN